MLHSVPEFNFFQTAPKEWKSRFFELNFLDLKTTFEKSMLIVTLLWLL